MIAMEGGELEMTSRVPRKHCETLLAYCREHKCKLFAVYLSSASYEPWYAIGYTKAQTSKKVREYVDKHCDKFNPDGVYVVLIEQVI